MTVIEEFIAGQLNRENILIHVLYCVKTLLDQS